MPNNIPDILYRCWSTKSASDLRSRKVHNGVRPHHFTRAGLLQEFQQHRNLYSRTPTAFVSTTSKFLRALHIAYKKMWLGEDERDIMIAFFTTQADAQTKIYHAKDFAIGSGSSEEEANMFKNEYIFLWEVPDGNVIHTVSMDLVIARGFALPGLHIGRPLPSSSDLRRAIIDHGNQLFLCERGYLCGTAACMFGIRAPIYDIASEISRCVCQGVDDDERKNTIRKAREEAIQDRIITVAEDLEEEGELEFLVSELSCLEDMHDEAIMEIGWELQNGHDVEDLQALLANEELKITGHHQKIAGRVEAVYQRLGL
ncbi:hypothetical protein D6C93_08985 [Aureobasidium pullulans]|nr:hypothetical protein D6C93_08985 [Aureobasidium pullulans]